MKPEPEKVSKTITITSDIAQKLEQASIKLGISEANIIRFSLIEYLSREEVALVGESEPKFDFDPKGFGMWADREDMEDSVTWVRKLREQEWNRS
jgi:hypothetical protein